MCAVTTLALSTTCAATVVVAALACATAVSTSCDDEPAVARRGPCAGSIVVACGLGHVDPASDGTVIVLIVVAGDEGRGGNDGMTVGIEARRES